MPVAAAVAPLAGSVIGAIAGGSNPRPPSLSTNQQTALNSDLSAATKSANGPVTIDPVQQSAIYDNIARSTTGANDAATHALASRGLGRSGILASAIQNNESTAASSQNQANLSLEQSALQNQQFNRGLISNLTKTQDTPGQSTAGAVSAGAAGPLAYSLQRAYLNQNQNTPAQNNGTPTPVDSTGRNYQDLGNYS